MIQSPYSLLVCSYFLSNHDSVLISCRFLGIFPFLLGYPICWHIVICRNIFELYISVTPIVMFLLFFLFYLSLFYFFTLGRPAKGLPVLLIFSKNQLLVSWYFLLFFLVFILFIYSFIFVISFLLITLGLVYSFSSFLRCEVWLLKIFLFS